MKLETLLPHGCSVRRPRVFGKRGGRTRGGEGAASEVMLLIGIRKLSVQLYSIELAHF